MARWLPHGLGNQKQRLLLHLLNLGDDSLGLRDFTGQGLLYQSTVLAAAGLRVDLVTGAGAILAQHRTWQTHAQFAVPSEKLHHLWQTRQILRRDRYPRKRGSVTAQSAGDRSLGEE